MGRYNVDRYPVKMIIHTVSAQYGIACDADSDPQITCLGVSNITTAISKYVLQPVVRSNQMKGHVQ